MVAVQEARNSNWWARGGPEMSPYRTEDVAVTGPNDTIAHVARMMIDNEIRHVPLIEDDVIAGLISGRDCLKSFADAAGA